MKGTKPKPAARGPVKGARGRRVTHQRQAAAGGAAAFSDDTGDVPAGEEGWDGDGAGEGGEPEPGAGGESPAPMGESARRIMELLDKEEDLCAPKPKGKPGGRARPDRFRVLDHTADVGIQAFGESLCEAFENAALGMFNIITDPSRVSAQKDFEVTVEGTDLKDLLHEWLAQLLILSQVQNMLFSSFKVDLRDIGGRVSLTGRVMGEQADPARHVYKTEIKAVTHHMLEVRKDPPMVKVLFDI